MLNMVISMMIRFHINVLCFCDGSAFLWGFCFATARHPRFDRSTARHPALDAGSHYDEIYKKY